MFPIAKVILRRLLRSGIRRGLIKGERRWMVIGALAWILRMLIKPRRPVVRREVLQPGETIEISNVRPSSRTRRTKGDRPA
jgi:hypothetical protein